MDTSLRANLITLADVLDTDAEQLPDEPLVPVVLHTIARDVAAEQAPALIDFLPRILEATTRGEYAARLRTIAGAR